ncbi:MAG: PASTA domain-containing protein, partial [Tissierellia bacterium]|nr:PASTA domain-containing protein [Tissierellia bacterium]
EKPIPPSKKVGNVKISNALEEIIMKCLEKYQSYRFQNIEELLISLNAINGYSRINMGINDADDLDSPTIIIPKVENNEDPLNEKIIDINILDENSDKAFKTFFGEYDDGEIDGKDEKDKKWRKKSKKKNKGNNEKPEKDINENEDDHKKNLKMTIIAILSALVVAIMGGIIGFRAFFYQPEIPVPDIRGKNEEEAKKIIEELGLVFEVENREYNNEFDKGEIIQQSVEEGKKVKKDFPIKVTVSMGNKEIKVPKLIGKYSIEAPVILSEMGLLPGDDIKEVYDDTAPAGQIIDQYPAENNPAKEGDKVNYTVSLGPETSYVIVPKLVGFSLNEALAKITQSGLVSKIEEKYSDEVTEGIVMNQSIASGQEVEEGSSVTLTVSKGPEETNTPDGEGEPSTPENPSTKTFPLTITLPTDRETVLVVVQKVTEEGREIVYSQEVNTSDQSIIVNVKGTGTQVFEIYTDNVLYDKTEITFD